MKIQAAQLVAFEAAETQSFEERNVRRLRRYFPELAELRDEELLDLVRHAAERAEAYGIANDHGVALYIGVAAELGLDFDRSGVYPWASEILTSSTLDAHTKMARIYERLEARHV